MKELARKREGMEEIRSGTGGLCPEAQADGVPCPSLDRDCLECENAVTPRMREAREQPTDTA